MVNVLCIPLEYVNLLAKSQALETERCPGLSQYMLGALFGMSGPVTFLQPFSGMV